MSPKAEPRRRRFEASLGRFVVPSSLALAMSACATVPPLVLDELRVAGHSEVFPDSDDLLGGPGAGALRRSLAALVGCDVAATSVQGHHGVYSGTASGLVEGCGRSAGWLVTSTGYRQAANVPGYEGRDA